MLIRREVRSDHDAVREVHRAAFARPGSPDPTGEATGTGEVVEAALTDRLREGAWWVPELSLVAVDPAGAVVGHVIATRGDLGGMPALGLGPLGVLPRAQRRGVGSALMHAVLGAAEAMGEPLIALLGDPAYYGRFGFTAGAQAGVGSPDPAWRGNFQARWFGHGRHTRSARPFRYAAPFDDLG